MTRRTRPDPRRAKLHRSYTVAEAAELLCVHRNTVRQWLKAGLVGFRVGAQTLILGEELRRFLRQRAVAGRCACPPGTIYCLRCRAAPAPAPGSLRLIGSAPVANVRAACDGCGAVMHRRVRSDRVAQAGFDLSDSSEPSLNSHLERA